MPNYSMRICPGINAYVQNQTLDIHLHTTVQIYIFLEYVFEVQISTNNTNQDVDAS